MSKTISKTLDEAAMQKIALGSTLSPDPSFSGKTEVRSPKTASGPMSVMSGSQVKGNLKTTKTGGDTVTSKGANGSKKKGK